MFRAAKQSRIFQDVVDQIEEVILSGQLNAGDTLPSERDLKDMFQTSRGTLREALRVLEQKGLIEIKLGVGGGAVVKASPLEQVCDGLDLLVRFQKISLQQLAEFREGVESTVADIAARRAGPEDVARLEDLLQKARHHAQRGVAHWREFVEIDKQIHQALAQITDNPMYIVVNQMVHNNIQRYYEKFLPWNGAMLEENYQDLNEIIKNVKAGRADLARRMAHKHVRRFSEYMEQQEKLAP
jgi:GntR family transcriptional regulator, transcriptional repressor for pyruvate dehydrogenase complex